MPKGSELMSIREAVSARVTSLRAPHWALPGDRIEIHLTPDGLLGPWVKFYSEMNERVGSANPRELIITEFDIDAKDWTAA